MKNRRHRILRQVGQAHYYSREMLCFRRKLFYAVWNGEFEDVKAIIDLIANPANRFIDEDINIEDDNGCTALRHSAESGFCRYEITE